MLLAAAVLGVVAAAAPAPGHLVRAAAGLGGCPGSPRSSPRRCSSTPPWPDARHHGRRLLGRVLVVVGLLAADDRRDWLVSAGDDTGVPVLPAAAVTHARAQPRRRPRTPGVVFLQVDGLPAPLLQWALQSGDLPTLTRWVRSGTHTATDVGRAAAVDHPGQPGGAAARRQRADPGLPLVREGRGPAAGGQPPQGRRR